MSISRPYVWFDPGEETTFVLSDARQHGIRMSRKALLSCAFDGRDSPLTGEIVRLRVCRLPGGIGTTVEEYHRFVSQMNTRPE